MVRQGPYTSHFKVPLFGKTSVGFELPAREELLGIANVCQRSKYYPSQSATTSLKDFFEFNPPTVLDPSHITLVLSSTR